MDIWEKAQTFPLATVESFREKLNASQQASTTPPGSPPKTNPLATAAPASTMATPSAATNILETLANIAKQSNVAKPPMPVAANQAAPAAAYQTSGPPAGFPTGGMPPMPPMPPMPFMPQGVNAQAPPPFPFMPPPVQQQPNGQVPAAMDPTAVLQMLATAGLPADQLAAVVAQLTASNGVAPPAAPQYPPQNGGFPAFPAVTGPPPASGWTAQHHASDSKDRGYPGPDGRSGRSRSRSPSGRWRDGRSGRDDRPFGEYGRRASPTRGGGGDRYRQRSPVGRRDSGQQQPNGRRLIQHDHSLPHGTIKVFSRTLFVGGVAESEAELREIFGRFGEVQTCITNKDKRHAFVKMYTRDDAVKAKNGMESRTRNHEAHLRTRWGVGFGPRDCSDYQQGVSVIPIARLTEADRKWLLTAPYGGTGGQPIDAGLVVEEPDIEIGAGVSSKAISKRVPTDGGGFNGPRSTRDDHHRGGRFNNKRGGGRNDHQRRDDDNNPNHQPVTGFGFGLATAPNGMPVYPPNFQFPAPPQ